MIRSFSIMVDTRRVRILNPVSNTAGPVIYWMSRDQRVHDNWALLYAQEIALENKTDLIIFFCLVPSYLNAPLRHYDFMLRGLSEIHNELKNYNIPFLIRNGDPEELIPSFIKKVNAGFLVTDFDPLRLKQDWKNTISRKISIPFVEVDAHNIVPCFYASQKQEFAAYTFRPKINRLLPEFLTEFPELKKMKQIESEKVKRTSFQKMSSVEDSIRLLDVDDSVQPVDWIKPGENNAIDEMNHFIDEKLYLYNSDRNSPSKKGQSELSPYLHYGQISAQRIVLNISHSPTDPEISASFLEELIVRRELSDNFCFYNRNYDNFEGFPAWAKETLNLHRNDKRETIYSLAQLENSQTHDNLWNASQTGMVTRGKMHGYMRMYWAKKILEWTISPEQAMEYAIYLNDKYELDGRDPNGYTGIAWSIGGVHDRAWGEREIFGKVRYMSYASTSRKIKSQVSNRK